MSGKLAVIVSCETVNKRFQAVLGNLQLDVPVYTSDCQDAVQLADRLMSEGVRLIIAQGSSYSYLEAFTDAPIVLLPYSYYDAFALVKKIQTLRKRALFIGTAAQYSMLKQCADLYALSDTPEVDFLEFRYIDSPESLFNSACQQGCQVIIGEHAICRQARRNPEIVTLEYDSDDFTIEYTIANAYSMLSLLERQADQLGDAEQRILSKLDAVLHKLSNPSHTYDANYANSAFDALRIILAQAQPPNESVSHRSTPGTEPLLSLKELEMRAIENALRHTNGDKERAAKILGINKSTIWRKLRDMQHGQ